VRLPSWRRDWTPLGRRLDALPPHDLRHATVALWIAAGASRKRSRTVLAFVSREVLDRYGHLLPGHDARVNDALGALATATPRPMATVTVLSDVPA